MSSISKLCANHLRILSQNYGVQLKSGHAHELVAAFFGYKSRAAMLADSLFSIENLNKVQILILTPTAFIDERRKLLEGLSSELPHTSFLAEETFVYLALIGAFSGRSFGTWGSLAESLTTEYLQKNSKVIFPASYAQQYLFNKPLYEFSPKMEMTSKGIKLTVENTYYDRDFQILDLKLSIELLRTAGHIGFSIGKVLVTHLSVRSKSLSRMEGKL